MTRTKILWTISWIVPLLLGCSLENSEKNSTNPNNRFSEVKMQEGNATLKVRHEMKASTNRIDLYYQQNRKKFCINEKSLTFNPALDLSSTKIDKKNTKLFIERSELLSNFLAQKSANFDIKDQAYIKTLNQHSGKLMIDITDFYLNKKAISKINKDGYLGYISVEFFLCSQLFNDISDPTVNPLTYKIVLQ